MLEVVLLTKSRSIRRNVLLFQINDLTSTWSYYWMDLVAQPLVNRKPGRKRMVHEQDLLTAKIHWRRKKGNGKTCAIYEMKQEDKCRSRFQKYILIHSERAKTKNVNVWENCSSKIKHRGYRILKLSDTEVYSSDPRKQEHGTIKFWEQTQWSLD